ncbi:hypothetical protein [Pseudarthrobacter sp. H2]|uniref:hypothetical protein n=1 Tax=Pseudarthrobacter sp. H2 TaxID=3418415 RepID=UPI003CF1A544
MSQHDPRLNRHNTSDLLCEVVVVAAGAAVLSAAVAFARSLRSAVVIDGGDPRNAAPADARGSRHGSARSHLHQPSFCSKSRAPTATDAGTILLGVLQETPAGHVLNRTPRHE